MAEPNFRPWTLKHYVYLGLLCVTTAAAVWFLPWISWFSTFLGPILPSPPSVWNVRDRGLHGRAFTVGADQSIYVVGDTQGPGMGPYPVSFDSPFMARYGGDGKLVWKHAFTEDRGGDRSVFHDVTTTSDGQICVLSHHYVTYDNSRVRCFDASGDPTVDYVLKVPRSTRILPAPGNSLVLGGTEVRSWTGGLAVTAAWLSELRSGELRWSGRRIGKLGGPSEVRALALTRAGEIVTGGSIGRGHGVAQPWLAKWTLDGRLLWSEVMPCYTWMHQAVVDVAVTDAGDILAAGYCDHPWVRRYSDAGRFHWEHRFAQRDYPRSLHATDAGLVVGSMDTADRWGRSGVAWNIRGLSWAGFPRWTIRGRGCTELADVLPATDGGVVALGTCANALVLAKFAPPD